ncbi:phage major capsid protein [Macrococcus brunensis]|uniref:Phage major capsid protein n=1 Tax=Macrococcus brunensis TaxID=198483 RepID=A0A4R6BCX5_9STAP|nr:phage major capsid protein [Macrococcus brunensis]TDL96688.1 phage major capsid protein [Macrococcus brunensis]
MAIKFTNTDLQMAVEEKRQAYLSAVREDKEPEVVEKLQGEYMEAYAKGLKDEVMQTARGEYNDSNSDLNIKLQRGNNVLLAEERKFFKMLVEDEANYDSFKKKELLPVTTVERIFEDIKVERPLLAKINFQLAGLVTRLIKVEPSGAAVWGEIFGKIQGQITANVKAVSFSQNKLTAFAIVPKDLAKFGPEWVERYVRLQLAEAVGIKLEEGVVKGGGSAKNEPIGLMKDYDTEAGTVTDKTPSGTLTFKDARTTAMELAAVATKLSVKQDGKPVNVAGQISLAVSPADQFVVAASNTIQTQNGAWITSLPFNIDVVASEFIPQGQVLPFVGSRYSAVHTGNVDIQKYDQTLALEDCDLFITKHFAHGMPDDNKTSLLYTLAVADAVPVV